MKRVIIVHGWDGSATADWIGWAAESFKSKGYEVIAPDMPDTKHPVISTWVPYLEELVPALDSNTFFVGHSIGCQTIMRLLERKNVKVGGAIFVAGWFNLVNLESDQAREIARPWIETAIDVAKVKANLDYSVAILGENDPWVPLAEARKDFETRLGSEVIVLPGAGHITSDDGFGPFPKLLEVFEQHVNSL
jgi:predicted alpha/beta hydrolase family esterase